MEHERIGIGPASGAERAGDRRHDPTAHGAGRHHLHQHQDGKDQRDTGERIGAELGDKIGLDEPDRGLHEHHQHVRRREPQQRADDGSLEQQAGSRVQAGDCGLRSDDVRILDRAGHVRIVSSIRHVVGLRLALETSAVAGGIPVVDGSARIRQDVSTCKRLARQGRR